MEKFPGAHLDERAMEIRLLCDHREDQVAEINRLTNRLRWNLVILDPALEASIPPRKMDYPGQLAELARHFHGLLLKPPLTPTTRPAIPINTAIPVPCLT